MPRAAGTPTGRSPPFFISDTHLAGLYPRKTGTDLIGLASVAHVFSKLLGDGSTGGHGMPCPYERYGT
jgi:hypothetical protein